MLTSPANEILYGGAAGGGKSHLMRVLAIILCTSIPGFQFYLFRRQSLDLEKNHLEGPKGFRNMLAPWVLKGLVVIVQGEIRFWNGSKIWLCHCKDEKHIYNYQGAEMHALAIDEATQFTEHMVRFLRSRCRIAGLVVPSEWRGRLPLVLLSANPIGVGVGWVKRWFITSRPPFTTERMGKEEGGMIRQYIPARLQDNESMKEDDPEYETKLSGLGSAALVAAMLNGDWNTIEGAFFERFSDIIIPPFKIPEHWVKARSFDWGSAKPFSVGWWAISNGEWEQDQDCPFRPGEIVRYREWYGAKGPNEGLKLHVPEIAAGIVGRTKDEKIAYSVADTSIFDEDGGPSIAETFAAHGVVFQKADKRRAPGWQQMRDRIAGYDDRPMVWVFDTCVNSIRTIPELVHDEHNAEDLNTDGEDHCADEWRYFHMSRPWSRPKPEEAKAPPGALTINALMDARRRAMASRSV